MAKIRGTHSSPGVYTKFTDLQYAAQTLGMTTLGLVGETLKGPAFEPIMVSDYTKFQEYFGGTSAEKYTKTKYPRYELPYIAKSYLTASDQLYVCRVLGLSGYNAGPAFVLTASGATGSKYEGKHVIGILRSRGKHDENIGSEVCGISSEYDSMIFRCDHVILTGYTKINISKICTGYTGGGEVQAQTLSKFNHKYNLKTYSTSADTPHTEYSISLIPGDKDYINDVLGTSADGNSDIFVEELYDDLINSMILDNENNSNHTYTVNIDKKELEELIPEGYVSVVTPDVSEIGSSEDEYIKVSNAKSLYDIFDGTVDEWKTFMASQSDEMQSKLFLIKENIYDYGYNQGEQRVGYVQPEGGKHIIYIEEKETYYRIYSSGGTVYDEVFDANVIRTCFKNYHEQFRSAETPWVLSELIGDKVKRLFRFITITDGDAANTQIKISIENIRPDDGTFDVKIRDFYDTDASQVVLESYKNVNLVPGTAKYIGMQIGTLDGEYETQSKYVLVDINPDETIYSHVPAGFLGYPTRYYGTGYAAPSVVYNTTIDEDKNIRKQYFGMGIVSQNDEDLFVDEDLLKYKGADAYHEDYKNGYTNSFHLDSRISIESGDTGLKILTVDVEGYGTGVTFDTVDPMLGGLDKDYPMIATEAEMANTIYADVKTRKFTFYPYGGFDGWDIYRDYRTTGDKFKATKYKGEIGTGKSFKLVNDPFSLNLTGRCITSDYYAFLAGYNQFENPEMYVINMFATPGIDYVNQTSLVSDVIEMLEEKRMDSIYIVTTPDKESGNSDDESEMYTASEATENLEDTAIDTYYSATYYPWVKYRDRAVDHDIYINLPATKDVVRNLANIDNKRYPWIAPAGIERGNVECTKMHKFTKLEDEDELYDGRINPLKKFSKDGVKIWGNKTMYTGDTPMNRINVVRLMLYMRRIISESVRKLVFDQNDVTLKSEFEKIVGPILAQIKKDRGVTNYQLIVSQTPEEMDAHELNCKLWVKPTPTLEYIGIEFMVTPQGVQFGDVTFQ